MAAPQQTDEPRQDGRHEQGRCEDGRCEEGQSVGPSTGVTHVAATDMPYRPQILAASDRPDKFALETRLIELGAALSSAQQLFKGLERDFYLATFGRYDE